MPTAKEIAKSKSKEANTKKVIDEFKRLPVHSSANMVNWAANWAIYNGKHYFKTMHSDVNEHIDNALGKYNSTTYKSKINVITSNTDISVAKLLKEQPQPMSIPAGSDPTDEMSADVATMILENAFGQNQLDLTQRSYEVLTIAKTMTTGWWKVGWDGDLADNKGDFTCKTYDSFQVFPDPSATDYFTMRYCYHSYLANKDYIEEAYSDTDELPNKLESFENSGTEKFMYLSDSLSNQVTDRVLVTERWDRPSPKYKKGRKIVIINNKYLVEDTDNPFAKFGKYAMPFVPFYWKKSHDDIYGVNVFNDIVNVQLEINKLSSLIMENAVKMGNLFWFVPQSSGITKEKMDAKAGSIIPYNPAAGGIPIQGSPEALPSYIPNHMSTLMGVAQDIDGIHEVSMGQLPERGSQMSGSALKLLMDSEQVRHSPAMRLLKSSLKISSSIIVLMAKYFMTEKRLLSLTGTSKGYDLKEFKGDSDLEGNYDIQIRIGSAFTTSPAAKVEAMLNLWDRGILSAAAQGDKAANMVLAALDYGNIEINRIEELNRSKARHTLNMMVKEGQVPPFSTLDDHDIHLKVLNEYRLSLDYLDLDPKQQMAIEARADEHQNMLNQQQMQLAQSQGARMGQPQGMGQPQSSPEEAGQGMVAGGENS